MFARSHEDTYINELLSVSIIAAAPVATNEQENWALYLLSWEILRIRTYTLATYACRLTKKSLSSSIGVVVPSWYYCIAQGVSLCLARSSITSILYLLVLNYLIWSLFSRTNNIKQIDWGNPIDYWTFMLIIFSFNHIQIECCNKWTCVLKLLRNLEVKCVNITNRDFFYFSWSDNN